MHVGILCEHSDPARGGAERYLEALAARLRAHGRDVTVCARTGPHARPVRGLPASSRPRLYRERFLPWLRDRGADVVLATVPVDGCDFYQPHHGVYAASVPAHLEPFVGPVRLARRWNPWRVAHFARLRRWEARVVATARVLALSPRVVADMKAAYPGVEPELFRPGVDLARFTPGDGPASPELLFVAHNFRLKGLDTALEALRMLPDVRLVVVGRDRPRGGGDRVSYRTHVEDLVPFYRAAGVLVHPTYYDTASTVTMEAMACGTPAVTTARDGNADLVREGGGAVLDHPRDADGLAMAVTDLLAKRDRGARARTVAERFDEQAQLDSVAERLCRSSS